MLFRSYSGQEKISIYLNILFNDQGFDPVHHSQEDIIELAGVVDDYSELLSGFKVANSRQKIPYLKANQCMADNDHSVEVQPDGSFTRCEHESILDSYGNLDDGILDPQKPLEWKETIERSDYCPECVMYPCCFVLKNCMSAEQSCIEGFRSREQVRCKELLRSVYHQKLEVGKNESL